MRKELMNFVDAYWTSKKYDTMQNLCVGTMISCLAFICRKLNVQTQTLIDYDSENEELRRKNQECRELEAEMARLSNFDGLKDFIKERLSPIEEIFENHDFYMSDFHIDRFGQAHLSIHPSHLGLENFNGFETIQIGDRCSENEILDTDVNKDVFAKLLPYSEMESIEIKMKSNNRCITRVDYCIPYFI
jgi:hypothetical protein